MKVGFIGLGNMGGAVAQAVAKVAGVEVLLSDHNPQKAQQLQSEIGGKLASNHLIAQEADVVFLGVKPQMAEAVLKDLAVSSAYKTSAIWISMLAGVTLDQLEASLPQVEWVRIMPNTPLAIGQGMTTLASKSPAAQQVCEQLLVHSGQVLVLPEGLMDAATAIAGCGPAFVYTFIEALSDTGVQLGLSREAALALASQTVAGAAHLVQEEDRHPAQLRDAVCSPGGSTIAGLAALEEAGFRHAVGQAVRKAHQRTQELGK